MSVLNIASAVACIAYAVAAAAWVYEGKPWMGLTFAFYAATIITLYMAGKQ